MRGLQMRLGGLGATGGSARVCVSHRLGGARGVLAGLALTFIWMSTPATAMADTATISVTNTAGQSDPAAGLARVFTVSGQTAKPENVYVAYRATGGAPCAPSYDGDSGRQFENYNGDQFGGNSANGNFTHSQVDTWQTPGTYVFCIWITDKGSNGITTPITQTITFRSPSGTITATVNPVTPMAGQQATVTVTGSSEAPARVFASIRGAGGAPCAPTFDAETGSSLIDGQNVNGSFSQQATTQPLTAGNYLICLWLASSSTDPSPTAGPQPEMFTVTAPPPPPAPCVVPGFAANAPAAAVRQSLVSGHCTVGAVRYSASQSVPQGDVVQLSSPSGTQLAPGAAVDLLVSTGPPCVVPTVRAGASLSLTQRAIRAAHCSVGRTSRVRSHSVRRGAVVGLSPHARTRLGTGAAVNIVVSRGRR